MNINKSNRIKFILLGAIINMFIITNLYGQQSSAAIDLMIGDIIVDSAVMKMEKTQFINKNKLTTSKKGYIVKEFTYSMFALGSNVREVVKDSIFPVKMKNAIIDRKINYHYINIEKVQLINKKNEIVLPRIDTIKIKFSHL